MYEFVLTEDEKFAMEESESAHLQEFGGCFETSNPVHVLLENRDRVDNAVSVFAPYFAFLPLTHIATFRFN